MAEIKNLLVYTTYEEMINTTPRPEHGQYCQVGEKFYQYLEEDEFDRALNDWVPIYPETVQIILPENNYATPSYVDGAITASKTDIEGDYINADNSVYKQAVAYVDGRFVDNNEKILDIETSIENLRTKDETIENGFEDARKELWDAIAALQDKLSEEEKADLVKELKPELDKIYRSIADSYTIDGTKNEIARQIKETTDVMWAQINDKYTSEEECVAIYKELLKDLNTDIDSKISDKASIDYVNSIEARVTAIEPRVAVVESDMADVKSDVTTVESKVTAIEPRVAVVESDMADVKSDVTAIESRVDDLEDSKVNKSDISTVATSGSYNDLKDKPNFATVATSGSYEDLEGAPEIPNAEKVEEWGFTKNTGDYTKPDGGIPSTDLTPEVQASLQKADKALQKIILNDEEYTSNGEGTIDLGTVIVEAPEVTELSAKVGELESKVDDLASELKGELNDINDSLDKKVNYEAYEADKVAYEADITIIKNYQGKIEESLNAYKREIPETYYNKKELDAKIKPLAIKEQVDSDIEAAKNEAIGAATSSFQASLAEVKQEVSNNYTTKEETADSIKTIDEKVADVNTRLDESIDSLNDRIEQVKMEPNVYIPSSDIGDEYVVGIDVPYYKGMNRKELAGPSGVLYTEMFDNILFAEVEPQTIEPSVKMIYAENDTYFTDDEIKGNVEILREVGSDAPDEKMFGFEADRGKVIYGYKDPSLWAGEPVTNQNVEGVQYVSNLVCTVNGVEVESDGESNEIVLGTQEYKYRVYFHNGPEITNNRGELIKSLHWKNDRYIDSLNSIKVYGTKAWYASTKKTENDSLTTQPLVKWNESGNQTVYAKLLPSCIMAQTFRIPGELKNLYIKNGGSYTLVPLIKYKDPEINGDYYTYTYDHEKYGHRGAIEIKVEF